MSGVVGVFSKTGENVADYLYYGIYALQHRGQVSTGMAVNNNGYIDYFKELGLVYDVIDDAIIRRLRGNIGIGHARYATVGDASIINAQPLVIGYRNGALAIGHDGNIVNYKEIKRELEEGGAIFQTQLDTEVIPVLIAKNHKGSIEDAILESLRRIEGTYGLVMMTGDTLIGARDPHGIHTLMLGIKGSTYILATETCAFDTIGARYLRDLEPGEVLFINEQGLHSHSIGGKDKKVCLFDIIYLARPDSIIEGRPVYQSRIEAGKQLAREAFVDADIVFGAPDSGTVAGIGYAQESGIPYVEGLIKNRYVARTFIEPTQEMRERGVRIKLNVLRYNVEGKRVVLVDDSIVRGTTMTRIVEMIRQAGATEVHVRIASPPIIYPCHLGMDTPNRENLIAAVHSVEEIRTIIGADSLAFISAEGLLKASGSTEYCTGCATGDYPIPCDPSFII